MRQPTLQEWLANEPPKIIEVLREGHIEEWLFQCPKCNRVETLDNFDAFGADEACVFCVHCNAELRQ